MSFTSPLQKIQQQMQQFKQTSQNLVNPLLDHPAKLKNALHLIDQFLHKPPKGVWSGVHPANLANDLKIRVQKPNSIAQQGSMWCGPASVCASFAADSPVDYAKMVLDLYSTGRAVVSAGLRTFPAKVFLASHELRTYVFQGTHISSADWIPLATLRESLDPANKLAPTAIYFNQGTLNPDVVKFYKEMGYFIVIDEMIGAMKSDRALQLIQQASSLRKQYYRVSMGINDDMLSPDASVRARNSVSLRNNQFARISSNHWVELLTPIEITGFGNNATVRFIVFSWGSEQTVPPAGAVMTLEHFTSNFFGFVAAKY